MPNGLLLPGGIEAPQALSTAHCATVTEAGTVQRMREATAASGDVTGDLAEMADRGWRARSPPAGRAASA